MSEYPPPDSSEITQLLRDMTLLFERPEAAQALVIGAEVRCIAARLTLPGLTTLALLRVATIDDSGRESLSYGVAIESEDDTTFGWSVPTGEPEAYDEGMAEQMRALIMDATFDAEVSHAYAAKLQDEEG